MKLRWYQEAAVDACWGAIRYGKKNPCIVVPTGGGKSLIIAEICRQAVESWGGRAMVLQHRKELIEQNCEKIKILLPNLDVGIYSAGLKKRESNEEIIVAGIQSCYRRAEEFGRRQVIIVDEAHLIPHSEDGMYRTFLDDIVKINPDAKIIGLTATPYRTGEGMVCDGGVLDEICYEVPVQQLMAEGFLCRLVSDVSKENTVSMAGVSVRRGEFAPREMEDAFLAQGRTEKCCQEMVDRFQDRKSILVFAAGISHAEKIRDTLLALGQRVEMVVGDTLAIERDLFLREFKEGVLRWIVNVGVLCLDEETEILCREGWIGIDEMTMNHRIAAWDNGKVVFSPPKLIVRRPLGEAEKMVSLTGNAIDIKVTENHRMIVRRGGVTKPGCWREAAASSLVGKKITMPAHGIAEPCDILVDQPVNGNVAPRIRSISYVYRKKYGMNHCESVKEATKEVNRKCLMKYKNPNELTLDECEFIGFWIGDGCRSRRRISLAQSLAYEDNVSWVDSLLARLGYSHSRSVKKPASKSKFCSVMWTIARGTGSRQQSFPGYFAIEPYLDKDGSDLLWGLNCEQFNSLLSGWHRADGNHHGKHRLAGKYVTCTNRKLLDTIQAIATCRGLRTSLSMCGKPRKENHAQMWRLSWNSRACISTGWKQFTYDNDRPLRVWCVTSSTGNIVTRRNGKVSVVGNTTGFDAPNIDGIGVMRATQSPGLFAQICGRGFRISEGKKDALICDFGGNIKRHGPLDSPLYGRLSKNKRGDGTGECPTKICKSCGEAIPLGVYFCPLCGSLLRDEAAQGPELDVKPDTSSKILSEPMWFSVEEIRMAKHTPKSEAKRQTLRVDYDVIADGAEHGNLASQRISEWICIEHDGYARQKACTWWCDHSLAPCPQNIAECIELWRSGAMRMPMRIMAIRDGMFWRITSRTFEDERPEQWADEPTDMNFEEVF